MTKYFDVCYSWLASNSCCWSSEQNNEANPQNADEIKPLNHMHTEAEPGEANAEDTDAVAIVITEQPKKNETRTFLCFANSKVRDDQIDFCPRPWFANLKVNV